MPRIDTPARQLGLVALALVAVAAAMYGPNAIHGGFISDAWSNRSNYVFTPSGDFFDGLSKYLDEPNIAVRPLLAFLLAGLNAVLGSHMGWWLAWLVGANVLMSLTLYLLLRRLTFSAADAAIVAILVLIFPVASSLRLWSAMVAAPVTIALALLGFLVALAAFERETRRARVLMHGASLLLFVSSLLLYELILPVMLVSVLVYRVRVPWRPAIRRWLVDCGVLLTLALTVTRSSSSGFSQSSTGMFDHATTIAEQAAALLTTRVLPFASANWYVLLLLAALPAVAALIAYRLPSENQMRGELQRWLCVMAAGALVVALGYSIFIPGVDYYIPLGAGIANRINAVPSIGWVLILYAGVMLASTLALQRLPEAAKLRTGLAALVCALIAASWIGPIRTESRAYTKAFEEDERVLLAIRTAIPRPPPGSTIWTFGQPVEVRPGIPVFGNTWDMTSSVQLTYDDPTLRSYVGLPEVAFSCAKERIEPGGSYGVPGEPLNKSLGSGYGRTYFLDTTSGRVELLRTPADCRHAARTFAPSPALLEGF
jgi:hypothetical protein